MHCYLFWKLWAGGGEQGVFLQYLYLLQKDDGGIGCCSDRNIGDSWCPSSCDLYTLEKRLSPEFTSSY